jgi:hypothetical protein
MLRKGWVANIELLSIFFHRIVEKDTLKRPTHVGHIKHQPIVLTQMKTSRSGSIDDFFFRILVAVFE